MHIMPIIGEATGQANQTMTCYNTRWISQYYTDLVVSRI